jgi:7-carboxy-7-deazaguanine synthase
MLQQRSLLPLLERAVDAGWWIEIETAATVMPEPELLARVSRLNVSPKLENSGNSIDERYRPKVLSALQDSAKAVWKFVAQDVTDLDEIAEIVKRHSLSPVYVMPEGIDAEVLKTRNQTLAEAVLCHGWNLTTRLHILLYGNRRGI